MKRLIVIIVTVILVPQAFGQHVADSLEVRLKLLEQKNSKGVRELALSVSFKNHSDKDLFIPNFRLFGSYSGIHVYEKDKKDWREINMATHNYYHPITTGSGLQLDLGHPVYPNDNDLTKSFRKHSFNLAQQQDSILHSFYDYAQKNKLNINKNILEEKPLFIKAHQEIGDFLVQDFDYILTKKATYKIAFNSEPRDSINYYKKPEIYSKRLKKYVKLNLPASISQYTVFYPAHVVSNVILFTNKEATSN